MWQSSLPAVSNTATSPIFVMPMKACAILRKAGVTERVMVDCSHANSQKDWNRQLGVAEELARQIEAGERRILGLMIESHLKPGRQDLKPGVPLEHGVSITDGCIGWEQTEPVLRRLAQAMRTGASSRT